MLNHNVHALFRCGPSCETCAAKRFPAIHASSRCCGRALQQQGQEGDPQLAISSTCAVVNLHVVKDPPCFDLPLLLGGVARIRRSACAVEYKGSRFLLTTATNVLHATQVTLDVGEHSKPFKARVDQMCVEADLALLKVTDDGLEEFEERVKPLRLRMALPHLQDRLQVLPPPLSVEGGESSQGMPIPALVSCIEMTTYNCAKYKLLAVQMECNTTKQHLGAPVLAIKDDSCVGLLFQRVKGRRRGGKKEGAAFVVPATLIAHFLEDIQHIGMHQGFPQLGMRFRDVRAPALRSHLQLAHHQQGIMVTAINSTSAAAAVLRIGDVLLAMTGPDGLKYDIGSDGSVVLWKQERVSLTHALGSMAVGDTLSLEILRNGREEVVQFELNVPAPLVATSASAPPSFLVIGGMVLTPLTLPYLEQSFGKSRWPKAAPISLLRLLREYPSSSSSSQGASISGSEEDDGEADGCNDGSVSGGLCGEAQLPLVPQVPQVPQVPLVPPPSVAKGPQPLVPGPHGRQGRQQQQQQQQQHACSSPWGPQQPVVVAHCEDTVSLEGHDRQLLQHKLVTGFGVVARQGALGAGGHGQGGGGRARVMGRGSRVRLRGGGPDALPVHPYPLAAQGEAPQEVGAEQGRVGRVPPMLPVHNLRQIARAVLRCQGGGELWLELGAGQTGLLVVMDLAQAAADTREVLDEYEVDLPVSKDLLDCLPRGAGRKLLRR